MTARQFREALDRLGLTQVAAAEFLGIAERSVRRWAAGDGKVPKAVAKLLRLMLEHDLKPSDVP